MNLRVSAPSLVLLSPLSLCCSSSEGTTLPFPKINPFKAKTGKDRQAPMGAQNLSSFRLSELLIYAAGHAAFSALLPEERKAGLGQPCHFCSLNTYASHACLGSGTVPGPSDREGEQQGHARRAVILGRDHRK